MGRRRGRLRPAAVATASRSGQTAWRASWARRRSPQARGRTPETAPLADRRRRARERSGRASVRANRLRTTVRVARPPRRRVSPPLAHAVARADGGTGGVHVRHLAAGSRRDGYAMVAMGTRVGRRPARSRRTRRSTAAAGDDRAPVGRVAAIRRAAAAARARQNRPSGRASSRMGHATRAHPVRHRRRTRSGLTSPSSAQSLHIARWFSARDLLDPAAAIGVLEFMIVSVSQWKW